jgi:hypothetical protein
MASAVCVWKQEHESSELYNFNILNDELRRKSEAEIANVQIGRDGVYGYKRPESEVQIGRDGVLGVWNCRPNFAFAIIRHCWREISLFRGWMTERYRCRYWVHGIKVRLLGVLSNKNGWCHHSPSIAVNASIHISGRRPCCHRCLSSQIQRNKYLRFVNV